MTDDRNYFAAILAEQSQQRQWGRLRREFGDFHRLRPPSNVRQDLRGLPGANQGAGQNAIGCLADLFQSGRSLPRPPYPGRRQWSRAVVAPAMAIALECNRMADD